MLYVIGTVKEAEQIKNKLPLEVYETVLKIISVLDTYGTDDGGVVVIAETVSDLTEIEKRYFRIDSNRHECVDLVKCEKEQYINVLYIHNNEYATNIILPLKIAPKILLNELEY